MKRIRKKILPLLFVLTMLASAFTVGVGSEFFGLSTASAAQTDYSIIRVHLKTMSNISSLSVTVNGVYSLQNIVDEQYSFRNDMLLTRGKAYTFSVDGGCIRITTEDGTYKLGAKVTLYSHTSDRNDYLTMYNNSYGTCNYLGNMILSVEADKLKFVNELNIDDYLCGVVPYEMSEGQLLESLKTQAVCARSYAYKIVAASPNKEVHVVDTTESQVYKGIKSQYQKCIMAVDQTAYQVLTYNGSYISCYYSSSNGGLTEDNHNAWGSTRLGYLVSKLDPYDTAYQNRQYIISKTAPSATVQSNVTVSAAALLDAAVYDTADVRFVSIDEIKTTYYSLPTNVPEKDRRIASIDVTVTVDAKKLDGSYERKTLVLTKKNEKSRTFFGLPTTRYKVEDVGNSIIFYCFGNGHGIGMSQNGTYARAKAGQKYDEILAFYFTNTKIKTLKYEPYIYKPVPEKNVSETEKMTKAPAGLTGNIKFNAILYTKASYLEESSKSIDEGTQVTIVQQSDNWYRISYSDGVATAFIPKECVEVNMNAEFIDDGGKILKVGILSGDARLRSLPNESSTSVISILKKGSTIMITDVASELFYKAYYNDAVCYIACSSVVLTDAEIKPCYEGTVVAYKAAVYEKEDDTSGKVTFLSKKDKVTVFVADNTDYIGIKINGSVCYAKKDAVEIDYSNVAAYTVTDSELEDRCFDTYATATRNVILYYDSGLKVSGSYMQTGQRALVIRERDNVLMILFDGSIYYAARSAFIM